MHRIAIAIALSIAAFPSPSRAEHDASPAPAPAPARTNGKRRHAPSPAYSAPSSARHYASPAPAPGHAQPYYSSRGYYYRHYYPRTTVWYGWGGGYGYYPMYPQPVYPHTPQEISRITTDLTLRGAGSYAGGAVAGLSLAIDGERLGFQLGVDGIYPGRYSPLPNGALAYGSTHLTFSFLAGPTYRLRVELGGAMIAIPNASRSGVGSTAALAFGPDVALSGRLGLIGPLGVEARAHFMPIPMPTVDGDLSLVLRFGVAALKLGWREHLAITGARAVGPIHFSGPQVGFGLIF